MPWECLRNCLLPSKNVMCRQDSLFPLSSLTAFGGFASKSPQLCIFFFFLYHSHESLLVVIWFCGWFICSRKGEVVSGSFSQSSLAAGAATGQRAISSKMKCHVLSPCSTHTNKHTHARKLFPNEIRQYYNLIQQTSQLTFSFSSLPILFYLQGLSRPLTIQIHPLCSSTL